MRKLKRDIDEMGIKTIRAWACILNALNGLAWIQLSRMGVPFADVQIVLFASITLIMWGLWVTTPDGIPTRADIRKANEAYEDK